MGAIALTAALRQLQQIGMDKVEQYEADLVAYTLAQLSKIPGIYLYPVGDERYNAVPTHDSVAVVSFNLGTMYFLQVAAILSTEFGVGLRAGCFCAQPYVQSYPNCHGLAYRGYQMWNCDDTPRNGSCFTWPS